MADATILVIDDNADNLRVAVDHLEQAGYEARAARSGESSLKRAASGAVQLILLDVEMPGWDGFETCRRLKAEPATADDAAPEDAAEGEGGEDAEEEDVEDDATDPGA